jgi:hypothetical protein
MQANAFKLSRIHAIGWSAAQKLSASEADALDDAGLAALNPYADEAERARWAEGFKEAIEKWQDTPQKSPAFEQE